MTITLYTAATPNGHKISIALEELGIQYEWKGLEFSKMEQKEEWFLKINPNGRIPALTDGDTNLFESGAILLYLADKYDKEFKFHFEDDKNKYEMLCWIFFQNAGLGPMQGQSNHFHRYAPEQIQYGKDRYLNETRRLYSVLDDRLREQKRDYLVGDGKGKYSFADITTFPWVRGAGWAMVDMKEFPDLAAWVERIKARPAVQKGTAIPPQKQQTSEEKAKEASAWIMAGQKADSKRKL